MPEAYDFSVVIATYDRLELCARAVQSVRAAAGERFRVEVVIVDDASPNPLPVPSGNDTKVIVQPDNSGPGPARMRGIAEAQASYCVILDDDDELRPEAFEVVSKRLHELEQSGCSDWLVIQFKSTNAMLASQSVRANIEDYLQGRLSGDFTPVFHRHRFLTSGLEYPKIKVGGERLLWWKIAETWGIPTWSDPIVNVSDDAAVRLTHASTQIARAEEHLELAEMAWNSFGHTLLELSPREARRVCMGGLTYSVLSGKRKRGWRFFRSLNSSRDRVVGGCVLLMPTFIARRLFAAFRERRS